MSDDPYDNFEIALRLFGTEVIGFRMSSQSRAKNWVVVGMICLLLLFAVLGQYGPGIVQLLGGR